MSPARGETAAPEPRRPDRRSASGPWRLVTEPRGSRIRFSRGGSSATEVLVATDRLSAEVEGGTSKDSENKMLIVRKGSLQKKKPLFL